MSNLKKNPSIIEDSYEAFNQKNNEQNFFFEKLVNKLFAEHESILRINESNPSNASKSTTSGTNYKQILSIRNFIYNEKKQLIIN